MLPKLLTPHPISAERPGLYQEDDFALGFTAALDRVLAPMFCTLDNLDSYFDPDLTPEDFLEWLSGWVGLAMDESWRLDRRRAFVRRAGDLYRRRGTLRGLRDLLALNTSSEIKVSDSGGSTWSAVPGGQLPGTSDQRLDVRVRSSHRRPFVQRARSIAATDQRRQAGERVPRPRNRGLARVVGLANRER
jgi:phage tail-like protein